MLEIRFHGRGGQGAVTSAELLAQAAISEGKFARAFPSFGPERRGAPVAAFCRIDDRPINLRTNIEQPDIVMVLDPSLFTAVDVTKGLQDNGYLIINSKKEPGHFMTEGLEKVATVNANQIAMEVLKRPVTNTVLLGALIRLLPVVKTESLIEAVKERFNQKIAGLNIEAVNRAYEETSVFSIEDGKTAKSAEPGGTNEPGECAEEKNGVGSKDNVEPAGVMKNLPKQDSEYLWTELEPGIVTKPGSSRVNLTGDWRSSVPVVQKERCIKCGLCWVFCPDVAQIQDSEGCYSIDLNYCKGCGICARECPTGAIHMEKEIEV